MDEITREGWGFVTLGEDFYRAAHFLYNAEKTDSVTFRHDGPIHYLFSHSVELMLKGGLLVSAQKADDAELVSAQKEDDVEKVRASGHDIHALFLKAKSNEKLCRTIISVENAVRNKWKAFLRSARDRHAEAFDDAGLLSPDSAAAMGVYDNATIGSELPELATAIRWLSDRHRTKGGMFRYFHERLDSKPVVSAFGLKDEDVVLRSVDWGCEELANQLRAFARKV